MSNRRAQDERIEGTPDGSNAITEIVDVPDAPTIGTATAGLLSASVAFTPATTGGTVSLFTATSSPGSITGTSATSPITVNGLTGGTAYTFTVRGANSTGTGPASSSSNSITPVDLVGAYDSLATVTLSATTSSIIFAGIPSGYNHLQVRISAQTNRGTVGRDNVDMQFNGDTGTSYASHNIYGDGSAVTSEANAPSNTAITLRNIGTSTSGSAYFGSLIVDVLDYSSIVKNKTIRFLGGVDVNGTVGGAGGTATFGSGVYINTSAVTSIKFVPGAGSTFSANSSFALYGVK